MKEFDEHLKDELEWEEEEDEDSFDDDEIVKKSSARSMRKIVRR